MRFGGDQFEDRPASHAAAHTVSKPCSCQDDPPGWHATWSDVFWVGVVLAIIVLLVAA